MAKNTHFNEFKLDYNNGVCQLNIVQPYKKRLPVYSEESVWKYIKDKYFTGKGFNYYVYMFFITDDMKVKGYYQIRLSKFHSHTLTESIRIILMSDVKRVVFLMDFNRKIDKDDEFPPIITKVYQKQLSSFEIDVLDSVVINDERYFSLKENSLI